MNVTSATETKIAAAKRPLSLSQRTWLLDELKVWQTLGLIAPDRADDLLDLYETPRQSAGRQQSVAIFALLALAALFVGLATVLLVGYNWEAMPAPFKLALIFGVVAGTYALAFSLRYRAGRRTASEAVFFLGCLFYGAAIWLVAQVFHLNAHYPDGFWWWALGVLPFALCLDTLLLHLLLVGVLAAWVGTEVIGFPGLGLWFFGRWPWLPNGAFSLLPFVGLGMLWAYRKDSPATVALYLPLLAWWVVLQPFAWHLSENPVFFVGSVGGLLLLVGEVHRPGSPFAIPYRLWGTLLALGALIPLSYADMHLELGRFDDQTHFFLQTVVIAVAAVVVLGVVLFRRLHDAQGEGQVSRPVYALLVRQWLPLAMVLFMLFLSCWDVLFVANPEDRAAVAVPTILANVMMLAAAYWLAAIGLQEDRARPFVAGVAYFLLWAVLRYIDLFGNFGGMLGAALMFFLCGAGVFGVAMFWNYRSKKETHHV